MNQTNLTGQTPALVSGQAVAQPVAQPAAPKPTPAPAVVAPVPSAKPVIAPPTSGNPPTISTSPVRAPAQPATVKPRHRMVLISFVVAVLGPMFVSGIYLWGIAKDQYASSVAFTVRKEEISSAVELLGGITNIGGSSASDTDVLYEFLQSQDLVALIDRQVDLRALWSKPDFDPVYRYDPSGTIEDLTRHWARLVKIYYDSGTGLLEVRALAFTSEDATRISTAIYDASTKMINELSDVAREDAIRYSRDELAVSVERLKEARAAITKFRNRTQIIDPIIDLQAQAGLLGTLQAQLAAALIEVDLLKETTQDGDPRMQQAQRRVRVTEDRIAEERRKLGIGAGNEQGQVYADLVGEYERLKVELDFAEQSYTAALATYDSALAEAQRKSRYLGAYILPTAAEKSQYPQRFTLFWVIGLFAFMIWGIAVLVVFSLRDRR